MHIIKIFLTSLISIILLAGCAQENMETQKSVSSEDSLSIGPLGAGPGRNDFYEDNPHYYYMSIGESITTVHNRETEEDSFRHATELLNFERTENGFDFSYINHKGKEAKKSFEIKSDSVVEDEQGVRYEWDGPEEWETPE